MSHQTLGPVSMYQCTLKWNSFSLTTLRALRPWGIGIVDDLLNSRDQRLAIFHPTWSSTSWTVPSRSPRAHAHKHPYSHKPQLQIHNTSIWMTASYCSPSWHLHNVSNHQNYDNDRTRDVMWVQSNFFFFFLWDSVNGYYTDVLWMVNYNKASMTSNESTKRAWDALRLNPITFLFSVY